jgi:hypothetical protein
MLTLPSFPALEANSYWLSYPIPSCSQFSSALQLTHPHIPFVVMFPAGLAYFLSPSLVFLFIFYMSLFSIWNLFYPLYMSIDPLSYRPPASWCSLFTVTQTIIACGHFWLFQCWLQFSQLMPYSLLIYHQEHPESSLVFALAWWLIQRLGWKNKRQPDWLINGHITFVVCVWEQINK